MLNIENISAGYGDLQVLFDVSLHVNDGECVALVGSNGAGKTSLLSVIGGHLPVMNGGVQWNGTELLDLPAMARAELGIAHIPQGRGILGTMNVMDNLLLGGYCKRVKARRQQNIEQVFGLFPKLRERAEPDRGVAVRRRAADARHRPCACDGAEAADAGRAVARSCADHRGGGL